MLRFDGERTLAPLPTDLWPKLSDAAYLVECIPDATVNGTPSRQRAACTVRPSLAFVRGSLDVTLEIVDAVEPTTVRYLQMSKGIGFTTEVETVLTLKQVDEGTHLQWSAEVKRLGGLLRAVPSGLIKGAAHKIINQIWDIMDAKLKQAAPVPTKRQE